jgi:hypothetical protein
MHDVLMYLMFSSYMYVHGLRYARELSDGVRMIGTERTGHDPCLDYIHRETVLYPFPQQSQLFRLQFRSMVIIAS